jgi:hypothetical protein
MGEALVSSTQTRQNVPDWVTGKITKCDFPDAQRLTTATWLYLDLSVKDYMAKYGRLPWSIAVHPVYIDELLAALELPQAEQSLLKGIGVVVDHRCLVPCLVDKDGQFHEI